MPLPPFGSHPADRAANRQALKPMGVTVDYHEFESGHYISDLNVDVLDRWLRRQLSTK